MLCIWLDCGSEQNIQIKHRVKAFISSLSFHRKIMKQNIK